jgi:hypothetical protein
MNFRESPTPSRRHLGYGIHQLTTKHNSDELPWNGSQVPILRRIQYSHVGEQKAPLKSVTFILAIKLVPRYSARRGRCLCVPPRRSVMRVSPESLQRFSIFAGVQELQLDGIATHVEVRR